MEPFLRGPNDFISFNNSGEIVFRYEYLDLGAQSRNVFNSDLTRIKSWNGLNSNPRLSLYFRNNRIYFRYCECYNFFYRFHFSDPPGVFCDLFSVYAPVGRFASAYGGKSRLYLLP
ncbi:hypothetical protein CEXT_808341 [Caerostris extrusa]|uniref:Uncharacterized protein n=1 Tax=Caerostris extrusa TaxID=172846 RepID=A0AAV4NAR6_CAEEX|nr:hypothetical protein CEXT_808341 [Caerostris extrusa]